MSKLNELKTRDTDREVINKWLDSIGADEEEKEEVLEHCKNDLECRAYYVGLGKSLAAGG